MTLQFIDWLKRHLDQDSSPGCMWVNRPSEVFKIQWPRAEKTMPLENLGIMWKWWQHKFGNSRFYQPTNVKGNFRSCLNSKVTSGEIERADPAMYGNRNEVDEWKYYQFKRPQPPGPQITPGQGSRQIHPPPPPGIDNTGPWEPEDPNYGESCVSDEKEEVRRGIRDWTLQIKAYGPNKTLLLEYCYDFMAENEGRNKLIFYSGYKEFSDGEKERYNTQWKTTLFSDPFVKFVRLDPTHSEFLNIDSKNGKNYNMFRLGFMLEVQHNFDIYVTRFSAMRLHFGVPSKNDKWHKLPACRNVPVEYMEDKNGQSKTKQLVFSYASFIHVTIVNEKIINEKGPKGLIDQMDSNVLIVVGNNPPKIDQSIDSVPLSFKIEHRPASKRALNNPSTDPIVSEDLADMLRDMQLNQQQEQQKPQPSKYAVSYSDHINQQLGNWPKPEEMSPGSNSCLTPAQVYEQKQHCLIDPHDPLGGFEDSYIPIYSPAPSAASDATLIGMAPFSPYQENDSMPGMLDYQEQQYGPGPSPGNSNHSWHHQ